MINGSKVRQMFKIDLGQLDMMTHEIRYFDYVAPLIYQAATIRYLITAKTRTKSPFPDLLCSLSGRIMPGVRSAIGRRPFWAHRRYFNELLKNQADGEAHGSNSL